MCFFSLLLPLTSFFFFLWISSLVPFSPPGSFVSTWVKYYCMYHREPKRVTMVLFDPKSGGKMVSRSGCHHVNFPTKLVSDKNDLQKAPCIRCLLWCFRPFGICTECEHIWIALWSVPSESWTHDSGVLYRWFSWWFLWTEFPGEAKHWKVQWSVTRKFCPSLL